MRRVRLDRLDINCTKGIELIPNVSHLYLQQNVLGSITLSLSNLVFLILADNQIKSVHLTGCPVLQLLDLRNNLVEKLDGFPISLEYLMLEDNPCSQVPDYRIQTIKAIPGLIELDEQIITGLERRIALGDQSIPDEEMEEQDDDQTIHQDGNQISDTPALYLQGLQGALDRSKSRRVKPVNKEQITSTDGDQFIGILNKSVIERKQHWENLKLKRLE